MFRPDSVPEVVHLPDSAWILDPPRTCTCSAPAAFRDRGTSGLRGLRGTGTQSDLICTWCVPRVEVLRNLDSPDQTPVFMNNVRPALEP